MEEKIRRRIVVMGGGTGTYTALSGLNDRDVVDLTAIVTMADNGGSSGILRDELGVLPPGDMRQALLALADPDKIPNVRERFNHRLEEPTLHGHPVGNLLLASLEALLGDPIGAIEEASRILGVRGRIIPVTTHASHLAVRLQNGEEVEGEHSIDVTSEKFRSPIADCYLKPAMEANPKAIEAILAADLIVIGPGDLFTSVVPVLLPVGITQALAKTKGKIVYIVNLMTKRGQTDKYTATRFREVVLRYCEPAQIEFVIVNVEVPSDDLLKTYEQEGEELVKDDLEKMPLQRICREKLISDELMKPQHGDVLRRSLIRHDSHCLARAILSLIRE